MASAVTVLKSKRGNDIIVIDGYELCVNKKTDGDKYYWSCVYKQSKQCKSSLTTVFSEIGGHSVVKEMSEHSHSPDASLLHSITLRNNIKRAAATTSDQPTQIIQNALEEVPSTSACSLPNKNAMRQIVYRTRKATTPKEPSTLEQIKVPEEYKTVNDEPFLARDTRYGENNQNRLLIFCTKTNLTIMNRSLIWLMDGTFRTAPGLFTQLYSIHAIVGRNYDTRKTIPVVYCFLTDKSEDSYLVFLRELKLYAAEFGFDLNPEHILTDFEIAVINVIRIEFPNANHHTCLFHLGQNIWRHIQKSGLAAKYGTDCDFALRLRQLVALAYLPPEEIPTAFNSLKLNVLPEDAEPVIDWFELYYVLGKPQSHIEGTKVTITRCPPLFPPRLWSIHSQNEIGLPRTQNSVEAWHRRWNSILNNNRYGVYSTIRKLMKEQASTNHAIERSQAEIVRTPPKKKRNTRNDSIKRICDKRHEMETLDFLRAIAHITEL